MLEEEELKDAVLVVLANKQVIIQKSHMPVRVGQSNLKKKILLNTWAMTLSQDSEWYNLMLVIFTKIASIMKDLSWQDIEGAMSVTEVHGALGLDKLKNRTFQIFKVI